MTIKNAPHINPKKKEFWEAKIKEWEGSGLSKTRFFKEQSIAESSFGKWYKRLRENFNKNNDEVSFSPIKIEKEKIELSSPLLILLKGNIKISIPNNADKSTLKMLLEILGVLPC